MRVPAVHPRHRPPVAAWVLAGLAALPLVLAWFALRHGWPGPWRELAHLWGLAMMAQLAGLPAGAALARGRLAPAFAALVLLPLVFGAVWSGLVTLPEGAMFGLVVVLGLDLWVVRAGLLPGWWARLKTGLTVLAGALLLALGLI